MTEPSSPRAPAPPLLSEELRRLSRAFSAGPVTLGDFAAGFNGQDHALLVLGLAVCVLHPFPLMGLAVPLGALMCVAGVRMSLGLGPWVPVRWSGKVMPGGIFAKVFSIAAKVIARIEKALPWPVLPARLLARLRRPNGWAISLCGVLLALPLPPPTNFPPAAAAAFLCLGILLRNTLLLGLGYALLAANFVLLWSVVKAMSALF